MTAVWLHAKFQHERHLNRFAAGLDAWSGEAITTHLSRVADRKLCMGFGPYDAKNVLAFSLDEKFESSSDPRT